MMRRRSLLLVLRSRSRTNLSTSRGVGSDTAPTSKVRKAHQFGEEKMVKYLSSVLSPQALPAVDANLLATSTVSQFAHGQSNPTFIVQVPSWPKLVLRKQPPGKLLKGAHAVDREFRVMQALQSSAVPVPATLHYCSDHDVIGTPFFVYKYVEGRFYKNPSLPTVNDATRRQTMYHSMIDTLARIHAVDLDKHQLGDYGARYTQGRTDQMPYLLRQLRTWTKQYRATETETLADMEYLIEQLPRSLPADAEADGSCLVHGDYRLDNVLFHSESDTIAAVLDWELGTIGDRLSDVAYLGIPYFLDPNNPFLQGLKGLDLKTMGIPTLSETIDYYGARLVHHSNGRLQAPNQSQINYYLSFSFFRSSAILQGVYKRSIQGNASAENANAALTFAKETAALGRSLLQTYCNDNAHTHGGGQGKGVSAGTTSSRSGGSSSSNGSSSNNTTPPTSSSPSSSSSSSSPPSSSSSSFGASTRSFSTHTNSLSAEAQRLLPPSHLFDNDSVISSQGKQLIHAAAEFIAHRVMPVEQDILNHGYDSSPTSTRWTIHPALEALKKEARSQGLWNLFLPRESDPNRVHGGGGLTNYEYALIAEMTGRSPMVAPESFNCSAPDTGNMEVLVRYGSPTQQQRWLKPLLEGSIRSCFAMTEPAVASSDATNMAATIRIDRDANHVVLNGHKWWISGALDPRCRVAIFMGRTYGDVSELPAHQRHSMVLVPMDTPGIKILRPMRVMGYDDAPHGHAEMMFDDVRVPIDNVILGEGRGFEIAQGRLGPGRIHHCMRLIGMAERALELMLTRVTHRVAFGAPLAEQGSIKEDIANARVDINQVRLLCLDTARKMDVQGNKNTKKEIALCKIAAPRMAKQVIDNAMQAFGGMGLSQDTPLAHLWATARVLQLADGPDQVHLAAVAKQEIQGQIPSYRPPKRTK